jgi:cell division protein FtsQ
LLNEKKKLLDMNALFHIRRNKKITDRNQKIRNVCFVLSIILSLVLIGFLYFSSDVSKIYRITVEGNRYLSDEDIVAKSTLNTENRFLAVFPFSIEKKLKEDPLIAGCKVSKLNNRLVQIFVEEKKAIAYMYENGAYVLVLDDDTRIPLSGDNLYLISKVPFLEGCTIEDVILIEKNLKDCDYKIINEISEIHYYPQLKYQYLELIMRDGNYIFTSPYGLNILNHYFDMRSSHLSTDEGCYYFEDISGNAYTSACPWEEAEEAVQEEIVEEDEE